MVLSKDKKKLGKMNLGEEPKCLQSGEGREGAGGNEGKEEVETKARARMIGFYLDCLSACTAAAPFPLPCPFEPEEGPCTCS